MPLTDPELDLLIEILAEDPTADVFLQVGEELVRRARWVEAREILAHGLAREPSPEGFGWLARASLETGDFDLALSSLKHVEVDPRSNLENARLQLLVQERSGQIDAALATADEILAVEPDDVVVHAVVERLQAPPPDAAQRADDPFYTVDRAERYVRVGRVDRAIRVFRRILMRHPGDNGLELRLRQLEAETLYADDDLSEELTDPGLMPPEPLDMPAPPLRTAPGAPSRSHLPPELGDDNDVATEPIPAQRGHWPTQEAAKKPDDPDEEDTDLSNEQAAEASKAHKRRRRRSLIRR